MSQANEWLKWLDHVESETGGLGGKLGSWVGEVKGREWGEKCWGGGSLRN